MNQLNDLTDNIVPQKLSKRVLSIALVIISIFFVTIGFIFLAKMIGFDPDKVSGSNLVPSPLKIFLSLSFWGLQLLVLYLFIRFVHKGTIGDFGFKKSILKNLLIGFGIGIIFSSCLVLGGYYLAYKNVTITWIVPEGVSFWNIAPFYIYFLIHLTINSLTEEAIFRCYPVELFKNHPRYIAWVVLGASMLFATPHFFLGGFSWPWLVTLIGFALTSSYLYFYWQRSIWFIIGFHNALNFYQFSTSGNWKLGGLVELTNDTMANTDLIRFVFSFILYSLLVFSVIYWGRKKRGRLAGISCNSKLLEDLVKRK